jgi:hypothetical protein
MFMRLFSGLGARTRERWIFQLAGLAALIWFLLRVIQKPTRAFYPCQRAAFPMASAFVASLVSGLGASALVFRRISVVAAVLIVAGAGQFLGQNPDVTAQTPAQTGPSQPGSWTPSDPPNSPIGEGKGIYPGRVTWIRDLRAAAWDGKTGKWWDDTNLNQEVLNGMLARSLRALAGARDEAAAWDKLFRHYNKTHGRGDKGYAPGELIAVKINLNNTSNVADVDNDKDAPPAMIRALLQQLVKAARVPQKQIVIYDASRVIPNRVYDPLHSEFPEVRFMDRTGANGREAPEWVADAIKYTSPDVRLGNSLPKAVVDATYLINMALLKGHEISGVTLCAKNHFGTIQYPSRGHADVANEYAHPIGSYSAFVDFMGSPNLGGKTMLYILDGLYATYTNVGRVTENDRWKNLFNNEWSASLFLSQDPVAIDSVGLDFLRAEWGFDLGFSGAKAFPKGSIVNSDNYMIEAARGTNAALGAYKPNGKEIGSLGVHEHWNNAQDKKYSRNLKSKREGIELFTVPLK